MLPVETLGSICFEQCGYSVTKTCWWQFLWGCGHGSGFLVRQGIFLPESTFSADSYGVHAHSPSVQSHASRSVRMLKIPNAGSHTTVWTHSNTAHTDKNGWRRSCGSSNPNFQGVKWWKNEMVCHANILPSTRHENNIAQPKPDK